MMGKVGKGGLECSKKVRRYLKMLLGDLSWCLKLWWLHDDLRKKGLLRSAWNPQILSFLFLFLFLFLANHSSFIPVFEIDE